MQTIRGTAGNDRLFGTDGDDRLSGDTGNDELFGGAGNDELSGGRGRDILNGGDGDDILSNGRGDGDVLTGGQGNDIFRLGLTSSGNVYEVTDYQPGQDTIELDLTLSEIRTNYQLRQVGADAVLRQNPIPVNQTAGGGSIITESDVFTFRNTNAEDLELTLRTRSNDGVIGFERTESGEFRTVRRELLNVSTPNIINGTSGDDVLVGGNGPDIIRGGAGNDQLSTGGGSFNGGNQPDQLFGGAGDDLLILETSNIGIATAPGIAFGGAGQDTFQIEELNVRSIIADYEPGQDTLLISEESRFINVQQIDGEILLQSTRNSSPLTARGLTILNTDLADLELTLTDGVFGVQRSGDGFVLQQVGTNPDVAVPDPIPGSTEPGVVLQGTAGRDILNGSAGDDTIRGRQGNDDLFGGTGDDLLFGNGGSDVLIGGDGQDTLRGGGGRDELLGGAGDDLLFGNGGSDVLIGGGGLNRLFGGRGSDVFVLNEMSESAGIINLSIIEDYESRDIIRIGALEQNVLVLQSESDVSINFLGGNNNAVISNSTVDSLNIEFV